MKTIIAGSRTLWQESVDQAMAECGWVPTLVISGHAIGVDICGEAWAKQRGIPIEQHFALWNKFGKRAGIIRNEHMAMKTGAEALVAVWDGVSRGTKHMIEIARREGLRVHVFTVAPEAKK